MLFYSNEESQDAVIMLSMWFTSANEMSGGFECVVSRKSGQCCVHDVTYTSQVLLAGYSNKICLVRRGQNHTENQPNGKNKTVY